MKDNVRQECASQPRALQEGGWWGGSWVLLLPYPAIEELACVRRLARSEDVVYNHALREQSTWLALHSLAQCLLSFTKALNEKQCG